MAAQTPTAATRVFALLGDPVRHSLSPVFQNAAMRHLGVDAVYVALRCDAASVGPLMRGLAGAGGGGNVTVPHKEAAAAAVQRPTDAVRRTGACNTFWTADGMLRGDNTDVAGFRDAATRLVPDLRGTTTLLIGAGGAAAAALVALLDAGAARVVILNRSPARARALADRLDAPAAVVEVAASATQLAGAAADLVVNATALGLRDDDPLPLDLESLERPRAVLDLVYRRGDTPWVRHARALGIPAEDGTTMLLGQGAAALRCWFGTAPLTDVLRDALDG